MTFNWNQAWQNSSNMNPVPSAAVEITSQDTLMDQPSVSDAATQNGEEYQDLSLSEHNLEMMLQQMKADYRYRKAIAELQSAGLLNMESQLKKQSEEASSTTDTSTNSSSPSTEETDDSSATKVVTLTVKGQLKPNITTSETPKKRPRYTKPKVAGFQNDW